MEDTVLNNESPENSRGKKALAELARFLEERSTTERSEKPKFEDFEQELRQRISEVEREVLGEELEKLDVTDPEIFINGVLHRRVVSGVGEYMTIAGPVQVTRHRYRAQGTNGHTECPLELRAGIVEGFFTPLAARTALLALTHLTPGESETLFKQFGGMAPSRSSLDRLPKKLSEKWEARREEWEEALRAQETMAPTVTVVAVSLDGVMVPMNGRQSEQDAKPGKSSPEGTHYREASCGSISQYNANGDRLHTTRQGRMPEKKKLTLKDQLLDEIAHLFRQKPDLQLVKVADGALDNWDFLDHHLPAGISVIDFYHGSEHLQKAFNCAYGEGTPKAKAAFAEYRHILLEVDDGVDKVIRTLDYQSQRHPKKQELKQELQYFRRNRSRMDYARLRAKNLPIGSGVVEAACKTLVSQRMKRSGQRWSIDGGQAILTFRGLTQSDRFDAGWKFVASQYIGELRTSDGFIIQ